MLPGLRQNQHNLPTYFEERQWMQPLKNTRDLTCHARCTSSIWNVTTRFFHCVPPPHLNPYDYAHLLSLSWSIVPSVTKRYEQNLMVFCSSRRQLGRAKVPLSYHNRANSSSTHRRRQPCTVHARVAAYSATRPQRCQLHRNTSPPTRPQFIQLNETTSTWEQSIGKLSP